MHANYLDTLDWGILIAYFLILIGIGIWASLKRKKGSSLFLAERSLKWHHIGFSMWGTNVGPSMLIASASAGFTTGIVSGNYAWYAFVFICLLAFVFAPRYLGARITTLPEFMGRRFGQSTRNILAWYTIVTILISWLALTLFAGGILIRQVFDIPMWQSALILLVISAFFTMAGGLKAVAYTNVFQMLLLIFVSATLTIAGLYKVGGVSALAEAVPADYWNLFRPNDDPAFPWLPIILGYPIMGVWFWCTDQSMVQPVLAAKNLKEGQMGANFTGWLKILDVPLYILPGIICLALYPGLKNPDEAYMTMVTNLFPVGMVGLVLAVLTAALISTVGSALNALSTVFTMDIYVKKFRPLASQKEIIRTGHVVTVAGALISVIITIAIDSIKGLNLFNVFQSVLGFIAPPMATVFLFGIFWKRTTTMASRFGAAHLVGLDDSGGSDSGTHRAADCSAFEGGKAPPEDADRARRRGKPGRTGEKEKIPGLADGASDAAGAGGSGGFGVLFCHPQQIRTLSGAGGAESVAGVFDESAAGCRHGRGSL